MRRFLFAGWAVAVLWLGACIDSDRLLGSIVSNPVPAPIDGLFGVPAQIAELAIPGVDIQDPTLTGDELEMYFTHTLAGELDLWTTTRPSLSSAWIAPHRVAELSTVYVDSNAEVSADGLTIYFCSDRPGVSTSLHLWRSARTSRADVWGTPVQNTNPIPGTEDISPSLDFSGLWLAIASIRGTTQFNIYLAYRATLSEPWGVLTRLDSVNANNVDNWDPALVFGATQLFFSRQLAGGGDIFQAHRTTTAEPFSDPVPVSELNTASAEGDPWVSPDGHRIYFASNRSGIERLYLAVR